MGALTGLIGGFTYSVSFILFRLHFSHLSHFFTSVGAPMWFQIQGLGLIISCAAGGAVGELLRSSNRFERSRVASLVKKKEDR
jgi:multisubunit Na+/H+ antiporter MnhB subunit